MQKHGAVFYWCARRVQQHRNKADDAVLDQIDSGDTFHADTDQAHEADFFLTVKQIEQRDDRYYQNIHQQNYDAKDIHNSG